MGGESTTCITILYVDVVASHLNQSLQYSQYKIRSLKFSLPYYGRNEQEEEKFEDGGASKWFVYTNDTKDEDRSQTVTRIGEHAFYACSNLKLVQFVVSSNNESPRLEAFSSNNRNANFLEEGTIVFPERAEILQIDHVAFRGYNSLRKVIVGSSSTTLGVGVFYECEGLVSAELPEGLQVIEQHLFAYCRSLKTIAMPSSVIKIGDSAFRGCSSLTSLDLPHGLVEIGKVCFNDCVSIRTLHIPSTVSSIGRSAFGFCSGLEHIKLPPTLQRIEVSMLYACKKLKYIDIPSTVSFIGVEAFGFCESLSHLRIPPSVDNIASRAVVCCKSLISIELPERIKLYLDVCGCTSLVNFAVPIRLPCRDNEEFLQSLKLGRVVDGYCDLFHRLNHRFDNSPLNK
eukprot:scaffold6846_cov107-Cylindrotheca_fusiformis.AAC.1